MGEPKAAAVGEQTELDGFRPEPIKEIDRALRGYKESTGEATDAKKKAKVKKAKLIELLKANKEKLQNGIYESDEGTVELIEASEDVRIRKPRKVKKSDE